MAGRRALYACVVAGIRRVALNQGKKMSRMILPCVAALLLSACASVQPSSVYLSQMRQAHPTDLASVATKGVAAPALKPGVNKFDLGQGDGLVQLPKYSSYYKLLKVNQTRPAPLKVSVNSYCSCLGYDKRVMIPVVYGLSSAGQVVDTRSGTYALHQATGLTSPLHVSLDVEFDRPDVAYVLVVADNSLIDRKIESITTIVNAVSFGPVYVRTYPVGRFEIEVTGSGSASGSARSALPQ